MTHKKDLPEISRDLDKRKKAGSPNDLRIYHHIEDVHIAPALKEARSGRVPKKSSRRSDDFASLSLPSLESIADSASNLWEI